MREHCKNGIIASTLARACGPRYTYALHLSCWIHSAVCTMHYALCTLHYELHWIALVILDSQCNASNAQLYLPQCRFTWCTGVWCFRQELHLSQNEKITKHMLQDCSIIAKSYSDKSTFWTVPVNLNCSSLVFQLLCEDSSQNWDFCLCVFYCCASSMCSLGLEQNHILDNYIFWALLADFSSLGFPMLKLDFDDGT